MTDSLKKIGMTILLASVFHLASSVSPLSRAMAQEGGDIYVPPSCSGDPGAGPVKCNYQNGDNYIGGFANGVPNGRGVYVYANGDRYEGLFSAGRPNGQGTFIFADDARYEGTFQNGNIIRGNAIFPDGSRYEGTFEVVQYVGTDEITSQPAGQGQFIFSNGDRYVGEFFAGQPFGQGTLTRVDETRCQGRFFNQNLDANATCTFPNGIRYEGELRQGVPHGQGVLIDSAGRRFPGEFREGQRI